MNRMFFVVICLVRCCNLSRSFCLFIVLHDNDEQDLCFRLCANCRGCCLLGVLLI